MKGLLRSTITSRGFILIIACLLFIWTFVFLLPSLCIDMAYSAYFTKDDADIMKYAKRALKENDKRLYKAQFYFANYEKELYGKGVDRFTSRGIVNTGGGIGLNDIAVGIVSQNREKDAQHKYDVDYLTQTLAALHRAASTDTYYSNKHLFICNVDAHPDQFKEVMLLQDYATVFTKHKQNGGGKKLLNDFDEAYMLYETQKTDYSYCLETAVNETTAKYIVILEDDVLVHRRFFEFVYHHINTNIQHNIDRGRVGTADWAFIKLSYPSRWRGFSNSFTTIFELITIAVLGGVTIVVLLSIIARALPYIYSQLSIKTQLLLARHAPTANSRPIRDVIASNQTLIFVLASFYAVLVCYTIGRPYLIQVRLLSAHLQKLEDSSPGCCTLAMLYPRAIVPNLVQYLKAVKCNIDFALDSVVDEFAEKNNLMTFIVEPNIAVHIGMVSNLRAYAKQVAEYIYINMI